MKIKITLSIAGLLSGAVLGAGTLTAFAAEPTAMPLVSPAPASVSQVDINTLKQSLDILQVLLTKLSVSLEAGQVTPAQAPVINSVLANTKADLLVLQNTLAVLYPPVQNIAQPENSPASTAQIDTAPSQNPAAEAAPAASDNAQASLLSSLNSKTTVGIVLGIVLVVAVVVMLRRKSKPENQAETAEGLI